MPQESTYWDKMRAMAGISEFKIQIDKTDPGLNVTSGASDKMDPDLSKVAIQQRSKDGLAVSEACAPVPGSAAPHRLAAQQLQDAHLGMFFFDLFIYYNNVMQPGLGISSRLAVHVILNI